MSEPINAALVDKHKSPFENVADHELQSHVEQELRKVSEPYRTAVVLRDIEDLSYDEIAEITQVSLGTVKSRITRGRDALRKRLTEYAKRSWTRNGLGRCRCPDFSRQANGGDSMTCAQAKSMFSAYLDGAVTGKQMFSLGKHLGGLRLL